MTQVKKVHPIFTKTDGQPEGTVEQWVSIFGNVDHIGDRVMPGFFEKSLADWKAADGPIPVVFSHQWDNIDAYMGEVVEAEEQKAGDPRLPEQIRANGGLYTKQKYDLEVPSAARVYDLLKRRIITQASFAYDVTQERKAKDGANELIEGKLLEVGPTFAGMNELTTTGAVKTVVAEAVIPLDSAALRDALVQGGTLDAVGIVVGQAGPTMGKSGRVLSAKNETDLRTAADLIAGVVAQVSTQEEPGKANAEDRVSGKAEEPNRSALSLALELEGIALPRPVDAGA